MLRKVPDNSPNKFINFSAIPRYGCGVGIVYCYNAVMKASRAGRPFVTLYLRDIHGTDIPGYVFDLASPLLAGGEAKSVVGKPVAVEWNENYLPNVGLTLILQKVSVVTDLTSEELSQFTGAVPDVEAKFGELESFIAKELGESIKLSFVLKSHASPDYCQGRVGGLCEHYWRMMGILKTMRFLDAEAYRRLVGAFVAYVYVHSNYIRRSEADGAGIETVTALSDSIAKLNARIKLGDGVLEVVHYFFGYTPKDIYARTIFSVADSVQRIDHEFALYKTIPLMQEGDAGYGKIKRYQVEDAM